jgi:hypothetical protein
MTFLPGWEVRATNWATSFNCQSACESKQHGRCTALPQLASADLESWAVDAVLNRDIFVVECE